MDQQMLAGLLAFFKEAEALKAQHRTASLHNGERESVAGHTWRLCLMAMCLCRFEKGISLEKVLKLCIVHDLGEADEGDVPAITMEDKAEKTRREERCLFRLCKTLEPSLQDEIMSLYREYNDGLTGEAKLVRGLDKLETLIQHNQGKNPEDFDYAFNLTYGKEWTEQSELLHGLRMLTDEETKSHLPAAQR